MPHPPWPEDDAAQLLVLVAEGKSGGEIVKALGGRYTRSAVIGKITRLGAPMKGKPGWKVRVPKVIKTTHSRPLPAPVKAPFLGTPGEILMEGCQYIEGDILLDGRMCGHEVKHKRFAYCPYHEGICLVKPKKRQSSHA